MLREGIIEESGEEGGDGGDADEVSGWRGGIEGGGGGEYEGEEGVIFCVDGEGVEGEGLADGDGGDDGCEGGGDGGGVGQADCEVREEEKGEEWWEVHFGGFGERDELRRFFLALELLGEVAGFIYVG